MHEDIQKVPSDHRVVVATGHYAMERDEEKREEGVRGYFDRMATDESRDQDYAACSPFT